MVPFHFDEAYIERVRAMLPELPDAKRRRFMEAYGLPPRDALLLASDLDLAAFYEGAVEAAGEERAKQVANWMLGDVAAHLNAEGTTIREVKITEAGLAKLVRLVADGTISGKQAKDVFAEMAETGDAPEDIVERRGMQQISDSGALEAMAEDVIAANPDKAEAYRAGKKGLLGFFVGQVMHASGGQANPKAVSEILERKLGS
jgi:aspartyl-tRNA(Asn)/glutamyl-tRNA(Gln) amidotransferase subunit B